MHMAQVETWIRERAYAIWQEEGCPEGREQQHWERAAREVIGHGTGSAAGTSAGKAGSKTAAKPKNSRARKAA